jgi:hypothetical protein
MRSEVRTARLRFPGVRAEGARVFAHKKLLDLECQIRKAREKAQEAPLDLDLIDELFGVATEGPEPSPDHPGRETER